MNSPRECEELAESIKEQTGRKVSSTTLRRYFGLLPSRSLFSTYVLDTLTIYCGSKDYQSYCKKRGAFRDYAEQQRVELVHAVDQVTEVTFSSIERRTLVDFEKTIPRERINGDLDTFLDAPYTIYPLIAPGGYGKSVALAHWVKGKLKKDICMFCPATVFHSLLSPAGRSRKALHLDLGSWSNVINVFLNDLQLRERKFLLVIDGLEELSQSQDKLNRVVDYFFEVAQRFGFHNKVKIVFSCSGAVWHGQLADRFQKIKEKEWHPHAGVMLDPGYSNVPTFSNSEIHRLVNTRKSSGESDILYECIPWNIREMMKIPISFHFIISLSRRRKSLQLLNQNDVMREFMKEMVFQTRYAEQKEDLLWKMIELLNENKNGSSVLKSTLKKHFPVHLKRETGYFQGYGDLLSDGILSEFRKENRYGIRELRVEFSHKNLYYHLHAYFLMKRNGGLTFSLFQDLSRWPMSTSWRASIIAVLFQMAYENEDYLSLKDICQLPDELLDSVEIRLTVGNCFRNRNGITDRLVEEYASDENGRTYFFERFVDMNHLFHSYALRMEYYLKYETTGQGRLFGHTILYMADLLSMNREQCIRRYSFIAGWNIHPAIHPWPLGRRVATMVLHHYFIDHKEIMKLEEFIGENAEIAHRYPDYLGKGVVEFEQYIMIALTLVQEFEILERVLKNLLCAYDSSDGDASSLQKNQNALPEYFLLYARYKLGKAGKANPAGIWAEAIDNYTSTFDDYQFLILLHWFLVDYHFSVGEAELSARKFRDALELSKYARYDLYTAWLLKNDPQRDSDRLKIGEAMIRNSGMNVKIFNFRFGTCPELSESSTGSS